MKLGQDCNETFPNGITNGAFWYVLNGKFQAKFVAMQQLKYQYFNLIIGGMQDFNYVYSNCFEITLELSCCKYPPANTLANEWHKNKRSLIEYMKMVHWGVKVNIQLSINLFHLRCVSE